MQSVKLSSIVIFTVLLISCGSSKEESKSSTINGVSGQDAADAFTPFIGSQNLTSEDGRQLYLMSDKSFKLVSDENVFGTYSYSDTQIVLSNAHGKGSLLDYTENTYEQKCIRFNGHQNTFCISAKEYNENL